MTTYHVELKGYCDVIVEANSEEEAFDRAVEMIPSSSLSIETVEVKGVLEGQALEMAHRYFPEHLPMVRTFLEVEGGDDVEVELSHHMTNAANIEYLETCYARGDRDFTSLQYQALYQNWRDKLKVLEDLTFPVKEL